MNFRPLFPVLLLAGTMALVLLPQAALAGPCILGPQNYLELDPFTGTSQEASGRLELPSGELAAVTVSIANAQDPSTGEPLTSFHLDAAGSAFCNSTGVFSNEVDGGGFCPAEPRADRWTVKLRTTESRLGANATLTVGFSLPVTDPVFHLHNLDRGAWDFGPAGAQEVVLLSGNGEMVLEGTVARDRDPASASGAASANGSVQLLGTFSEIRVHLRKQHEDVNDDAASLQISVASGPANRPLRTLPDLYLVTFWEMTSSRLWMPDASSFEPASAALTQRKSGPLSATNKDVTTNAAEHYDLFYSDANGHPDPNGAYLSLEAAIDGTAGTLNVAEAALSFRNGPAAFADRVTGFCIGTGSQALPGTLDTAADGNFLTFPFMGSSAPEPARLRLTLGFPL